MEHISLDLVPMPGALDTGRSLPELEAVVERGQQTFVEVGLALLEIRDRRLYRQSHDTFDGYCLARWGWGRVAADQHIAAARVVENVKSTLRAPASPPSLTQAVALRSLPPAEQREVAAAVDFSQTTVRELQDVVKARKEAKSHAVAHEERRTAYEERASVRDETPADLPYGRVVRGVDALTYLATLPSGEVDLCITSPPYWAKRTYVPGNPLELGQEATPEGYVEALCAVINAIGRVLTPEGCLFLNIGDTLASQPGQYRGDPARRRGISDQAVRANGTAPARRVLDVATKSLCGIPERVVLELLIEYGWRLAGKVVWHKVGHQPENVFDRLTQAWEPVYVLTRAEHCYFDRGDERDDVWAIPVGRGGAAAGHLAPFPEALVERAIRHAGREGGVVLDPFAGSGTVCLVAQRLGMRFLGCDLAPQAAAQG